MHKARHGEQCLADIAFSEFKNMSGFSVRAKIPNTIQETAICSTTGCEAWLEQSDAERQSRRPDSRRGDSCKTNSSQRLILE